MLFAVAAIVFFIILLLTNDVFFNWKFERHHKVLGWYMKPLFIIPIVIFAFKKSFTGIFASIYKYVLLPCSCCKEPSSFRFLAFEMEYLICLLHFLLQTAAD